MAFEWGKMDSDDLAIERGAGGGLGLDAVLMVAGERVPATIVAMSRTEVGFRSPETLIAGETVEMDLGGVGYVQIRIIWSRGGEAGGTFLDLD